MPRCAPQHTRRRYKAAGGHDERTRLAAATRDLSGSAATPRSRLRWRRALTVSAEPVRTRQHPHVNLGNSYRRPATVIALPSNVCLTVRLKLSLSAASIAAACKEHGTRASGSQKRCASRVCCMPRCSHSSRTRKRHNGTQRGAANRARGVGCTWRLRGQRAARALSHTPPHNWHFCSVCERAGGSGAPLC